MAYTLAGRNVLVTGGSRGLGALLCERFAKEGCNVAVNYNASEDRAKEVVKQVESQGRKGLLIKGDVSLLKDCKSMVAEAKAGLGGLDIIIANAGWTKMSNFSDLDALTEEDWDKCWNVNTKPILHLLREAAPIFNNNADGGVFLTTSSVAGLMPSGSSMAYSVTKAAGLHLMQCLAQTQGPKIRVNAVCPGWLATEWGQTFDPKKIEAIKEAAVLKQESRLDDTVDAFVMAARNSSMTGMKIRVDAGIAIRN